MKKTLAILLILCATAAFAADKKMEKLEIPTARSNGMGGHHIASTDNVFSLLVNPAATMRTRQRSFFDLSFDTFSPQATFGLLGSLDSVTSGDMGKLAKTLNDIGSDKGTIPLGVDIKIPLTFAWVADGFGFGVFNREFINANIIGTNVQFNIYGDLMVPVGFAFKVLDMEHHSVDAGVTVKPFFRIIAEGQEKLTNLAGQNGMQNFVDNSLNTPLLFGVGLDLGFMYRWDTGLSAGLTFDDIVTRGGVVGNLVGKDTNTYYVPFTVNLGAAYELDIGKFWTSAPSFLARTGITFMLDWHDVLNVFYQNDYLNQRNALLDLSAGIQLSIFDIFMLRAGMNEMLPAVGLGFNLGPVQLDVAYYGREFGLEPGQLSSAALDLTVAIRPGAKKRDWPWTRRSIAGLISKSEEM